MKKKITPFKLKAALHKPVTVSGLVLPTEEELYQWAIKKAQGFERETLARQCFFEGAKWATERIAEQLVGKTCG